MQPRLSKLDRSFANVKGKRPPVPGKEDDFDSQCSSQESKKELNLTCDLFSQLHMNHHPMSHKFSDSDPRNCLHVSGLRNSNSEPFNLEGESSTKCGSGNVNPSVTDLFRRENGVGETCDDAHVDREKFFPSPDFVRGRPVLPNQSHFRNHPRRCGGDEIIRFDDSFVPSESGSPATCSRWSGGLNSLLEDAEGLELFRRFLENGPSGNSKALDFVFSCRGFGLMNELDRDKVVEVARLIHKRFVLKEAGLRLDPEVKRRVTEKVKKLIDFPGDSSTDFSRKDVFAEASKEAEKFLEKEMYPLFLESDSFLDRFRRERESTSDHRLGIREADESEDSAADRRDPTVPRRPSPHRDDEEDEERGGGRKKPPPSPKSEESHTVVFGPALPALPEEKELELPSDSKVCPERISSDGPQARRRSGDDRSASVLQLSSLSLMATRRMRQKHMESLPSDLYPRGSSSGRPRSSSDLSNPYHVSYAPGSAQDSELQSLSSDALTEDAVSFTDSSLDGRLDVNANRPLSVAAYKKHVRYVRNFAAKNHEVNFPGRFVPRTAECVPRDCNLAATNPQAFASVLVGKLQVVKENQEKMERIVTIMQGFQNADNSVNAKDSPVRRPRHHQSQRNHHGRGKSKQGRGHHSGNKHDFPSVPPSYDSDDNAQSILDDHVSQLWNSLGNTPDGLASGTVTPDGRKVDRVRAPRCFSSADSFAGRPVSGQRCRENATSNVDRKTLHRCPRDLGRVLFDEGRAAIGNGSAFSSRIHPNGGFPFDVGSSQKFRTHLEKFPIRASTGSRCRNESGVGEGPGAVLGDALRNGTRPFPFSGSSSCEPNSRVVVRFHRPMPEEDSVDREIQSERSAFGKRGVRRKQPTDPSSGCDAAILCTNKSKRPIKIQDSSRAEMEHSQIKMISNMYKTDRHVSEDVIRPSESLMTRSKSLERNKVVSSSKFSEAIQNSAFLECRPNSMGTDGRSKALREASKRSLSNLPPPPPKTKGSSCPQSHLTHDKVLQSSKKSLASTVVGYYMQNEPIPYRITLPGKDITLGQLKTAISKKENYRFFFKKLCSDFDTDVVHEEVSSDDQVLPLWEGKVVCRIERTD